MLSTAAVMREMAGCNHCMMSYYACKSWKDAKDKMPSFPIQRSNHFKGAILR